MPNPKKFVTSEKQVNLVAAAANTAKNTIPGGSKYVNVVGVTTNADDWITLPSINEVPIGFKIIIACNAGSNFELRTPTSSNEKINDQDSDGTKEYLCTDTDIVEVTKRTTTGWEAHEFTKLGAVVTAVVPD